LDIGHWTLDITSFLLHLWLVTMQCNPVQANDLFFNPRNVGEVAEPNFVGRAASFECGATVRISLYVDDSCRIIDAKFKAAGCSALVASASFLTEQIKGETTAVAAALGQHPDSITTQLGPQHRERSECAALACAALVSAIAQYSDSVREGWEGDEALICTCFGVSERTIAAAIQTNSLTTIAEVTRACNAGAGCRSCYSLIEDILDQVGQAFLPVTPPAKNRR
jgi:NifU-like protein